MFELASDQWLERLIEKDTIIPVLAIIFGCMTGMVAIVFTTMAGMAKAKAREATRREIAAYVAEGSIAPQDAVARCPPAPGLAGRAWPGLRRFPARHGPRPRAGR